MGRHSGRIESLDALRGFALLGILVVNIQVFSGWGFIGPDVRATLNWSDYDPQLHAALKILAHDKFYSLFSLLFGYSFVLLAHKKGAGATRTHLLRMLGLLVIGMAHAIVLWPWDILFLYAAMGLALTFYLQRSPAALVAWAVLLLSLIAALRWYGLAHEADWPWGNRAGEILSANVPHLADGGYVDVIRANIELKLTVIVNRIEEFRPIRVLAMFLLGAAASRLRLAEPKHGPAGLLPAIAVLGLPAAMALAVAEQMLSPDVAHQRLWFIVAETLAAPVTAVSYAAALLWWWNRDGPVGRRVRGAFAPAGRMALTNYLAQSAICVPLFYGFGLGLFAELSLARLLLIAAGVFAAQLIVSRLWLAVFRQGPMEWLWRWQMQGSRPALLVRD